MPGARELSHCPSRDMLWRVPGSGWLKLSDRWNLLLNASGQGMLCRTPLKKSMVSQVGHPRGCGFTAFTPTSMVYLYESGIMVKGSSCVTRSCGLSSSVQSSEPTISRKYALTSTWHLTVSGTERGLAT